MLAAISEGPWDRMLQGFVQGVFLYAKDAVWDEVAPQLPAAIVFVLGEQEHLSDEQRTQFRTAIEENASTMKSLGPDAREGLLNRLLYQVKRPKSKGRKTV
jgi:hypothetical protein